MFIRFDRIEVNPQATLVMQGCPIRCPGCNAPHLWDERGGTAAHTDAVAWKLKQSGLPVVITGGEPFAQPEALADLVIRLRIAGRHTTIYTGFVYEDLLVMGQAIPEVNIVLGLADVLVDGPYMAWRDDGQGCKRVIDLQATHLASHLLLLR